MGAMRMKKSISALLVVFMMFSLVSCVVYEPPADVAADAAPAGTAPVELAGTGDQEALETVPQEAPESSQQPSDYKIVILGMFGCGGYAYDSALHVQGKYGEDKVEILSWPFSYLNENEEMTEILRNIADDPDVKVLVINYAVINTNASVDALLEKRDDIFIAYCDPAENPPEVSKRAHLVLNENGMLRGELIVMQAKALGAKVFAHYSFPRHMAVPTLSQRRDIMKDACEREGLTFVDLTSLDPTDDGGIPAAQQFILEDVPRQVARLGKDTAFFATNCAMQVPLIIKIVEEGAIYPEPCCPSPYHGFVPALGIPDRRFLDDEGWPATALPSEIIADTRSVLAERNMTGRMSVAALPPEMLFTYIAVEYGIKWMNGEVPKEGVDTEVLEQLIAESIVEYAGEEVPPGTVYPLSFMGRTYWNFMMVTVGYVTY